VNRSFELSLYTEQHTEQHTVEHTKLMTTTARLLEIAMRLVCFGAAV
jgi:hypothetical protein